MRLTLALICALLVVGTLSVNLRQEEAAASNGGPVIGVYTQPSEIDGYPASQFGYIAASYIKYLELAGARVIPIPYDADSATLDKLFNGINGLLFPGGSADLTRKSKFGLNAEYLFKKALKANDDGQYFPIWGTCLGFELINTIVADFPEDVLSSITNEAGVARAIIYTQYTSRLYAGFPLYLKMYSQYETPYYYNHHWCVKDKTYDQYPVLDKFFARIAHTSNGAGDSFIAAVEARKYPVYGTQFHPEKNNFEFRVKADHGKQACEITQFLANFFVSECRKNTHAFTSASELKNLLIWNTEVLISPPTSSFEQIYEFPNSKVGEVLYDHFNLRHD